MLLELRRRSDIVALPRAVLCVDCESISTSHTDECPVCSSRSLLSLAKMLGGSLLAHRAKCREPQENSQMQFDVQVSIELQRVEPRELNTAVEGIAFLIGPTLGRGRASFHINVEPVADTGMSEAKAA
jgi:hypothetical protein